MYPGSEPSNEIQRAGQSKLRHVREELSAHAARDMLLFLIAFRLLNTLSVATFFQPDEYFQSLEPALQMAFGEGSGAWITWVRFATSSPFRSNGAMQIDLNH